MNEKALRNLVKQLRRKASIEWKRVGNETTRYQGMCKGLSLGYTEAANKIDKILKETP
jgi:hypothetical protein